MTRRPTSSAPMKSCITLCWECRDTCQDTLFNHCLPMGGEHVASEHVTLMTDCMEICQTAADFMRRNSSMHAAVCAACAEICEACAKSCESIGSKEMQACAEACRACAEECRKMGGSQRRAA